MNWKGIDDFKVEVGEWKKLIQVFPNYPQKSFLTSNFCSLQTMQKSEIIYYYTK